MKSITLDAEVWHNKFPSFESGFRGSEWIVRLYVCWSTDWSFIFCLKQLLETLQGSEGEDS